MCAFRWRLCATLSTIQATCPALQVLTSVIRNGTYLQRHILHWCDFFFCCCLLLLQPQVHQLKHIVLVAPTAQPYLRTRTRTLRRVYAHLKCTQRCGVLTEILTVPPSPQLLRLLLLVDVIFAKLFAPGSCVCVCWGVQVFVSMLEFINYVEYF